MTTRIISTNQYNILNRDSDQLLFENQLIAQGVVFDGVTDCAFPLQNVINSFTADGNLHSIVFPPNFVAFINSNAGYTNTACASMTANGTMLTIPSTLMIDFNHGTFIFGSNSAHQNTSSGILFTKNPNVTWDYGGSYGFNQVEYSNLHLITNPLSASAFNISAVVFDATGATQNAGGPARVTIDRFFFDSCGKNFVTINNDAYLMKFHRCEFFNWNKGTVATNAAPGFAVVQNGVNTGAGNNEDNSFIECAFYGGGIAIGTYGSEMNFYNCSFDYNTQAFALLAGVAPYDHIITFNSCHFETYCQYSHYGAGANASGYPANTQYYIDNGNFSNVLVVLNNCFMYTYPNGSNTGNQLTAFVNPGNGNAAAPWGMVVRNPSLVLNLANTGNTIPFYNTGANSRFVLEGFANLVSSALSAGNNDNLAPAGFDGTVNRLDMTAPAGAANVNGLLAGLENQTIIATNIDSTNTITFVAQASTSTASNRLRLGSPLVLNPGDAYNMKYYGGSVNRWVVIK
jgi:hypothetical protein